MNEPTELHNNADVGADEETEHWLSIPGIHWSLAQSEESIAAGRTYGVADVRAPTVPTDVPRAGETAAGTHGPAADLALVADSIAGADQESIDGWRAETDLWEAAVLPDADADHASGNSVGGEDFRRR